MAAFKRLEIFDRLAAASLALWTAWRQFQHSVPEEKECEGQSIISDTLFFQTYLMYLPDYGFNKNKMFPFQDSRILRPEFFCLLI